MPLPRSMRVRFMVDTNMYHKGINHENVFESLVGCEPSSRVVDHEDVFKYGIDWALHHSEEPWSMPIIEEEHAEA